MHIHKNQVFADQVKRAENPSFQGSENDRDKIMVFTSATSPQALANIIDLVPCCNLPCQNEVREGRLRGQEIVIVDVAEEDTHEVGTTSPTRGKFTVLRSGASDT
jgi:hypothetical protein